MKIRSFLKRGEHDEASARQALQNILSMLNFDPAAFGIFEIWDNEMRGLIKNCEAIGLQGKRLWVKVPSTVHRQELSSMKDRLIRKINQAMGRQVITDIYFELNQQTGGKPEWQKA